MSAWAHQERLDGRILVSDRLDRALEGAGAAIIANALRDHESAARAALEAGASVLIEKPVATSSSAARDLVARAEALGARIAASHVFLFASYVDRFAEEVEALGPIQRIAVEWADPAREIRYGEAKRYDSSVPVFADCLPHVVSILGRLGVHGPQSLVDVVVDRGGAGVDLLVKTGATECRISLARNSARRKRHIQVMANGGSIELDFATEPGVMRADSHTVLGDEDWYRRPRPVARMLGSFLSWAAGGSWDSRLDFAVAIGACELIEATSTVYGRELTRWIAHELRSGAMSTSLKYAIEEATSSRGVTSPGAPDLQRLHTTIRSLDGSDRLRRTVEEGDPTLLLGLLESVADRS
jgi:predicted dehydrogenase